MAEDNKKSQGSIPTGKVQRAARFARTGVNIGKNYVKHYAKKAIDPSRTREELDKDNAKDIYGTLSELKGSALKVAQMMSMSEGVLPAAYSEQFKMSQYSAPPLSLPLVVKTFQKTLGKTPFDIFDTFSKEAVNAASIGQVHSATIGEQKFAVKVQYPGVADSIDSDLRMVRPFAVQLLGLSQRELDLYMNEVGDMLKAETDYGLELRRSKQIAEACKHIENTIFPNYYEDYSSNRILTMDWLSGYHLNDFLEKNPSQEVRNKIGQALWDFYDYQMHVLNEVHADPHPGNFLMREDGTVGIIDFGCVKVIPKDYYKVHFRAIDPSLLTDEAKMITAFENLGFIKESDTPEQREFFTGVFREMLELTTKPFQSDFFDFGEKAYFERLYAFGEKLSSLDELRKSKEARGSQHSLYLNRAYFGLYFLLHELKAQVHTHTAWKDED
ncbi:MAG: AarF/ABC1/UbiB kinase family protein [Bernardetiaceae bacterium]|nr:AarF/ABC1/UbiB kinase family protein [Bernardetiaceae bacterium]